MQVKDKDQQGSAHTEDGQQVITQGYKSEAEYFISFPILKAHFNPL